LFLRPLKKPITKKSWRKSGSSNKSACLACTKAWVQTSVPVKKTKNQTNADNLKIICNIISCHSFKIFLGKHWSLIFLLFYQGNW
jgi:hypothetical protein